MFRKHLKRYLPDPAALRSNKWVARFGLLVDRPGVWHLHRRSVSGGVAIGMFTGLFPAPFQMISAALLSIVFRRNLPVAVLTTLYTNPVTFVPLYLLGYEIGRRLLGAESPVEAVRAFDIPIGEVLAHPLDALQGLAEWALALGKPLVLGVFVLGVVLAAAGYLLVEIVWRAWTIRAWRARQRRRSR